MISVTQEIRTSIYRAAAAGAAHRALGATPNVHSTMPDTTETARFLYAVRAYETELGF